MAKKTDAGGQPTMEKLAAEGVSPRKCIAMGESYGSKGGSKPAGNSQKPQPALASLNKGRGGSY